MEKAIVKQAQPMEHQRTRQANVYHAARALRSAANEIARQMPDHLCEQLANEQRKVDEMKREAFMRGIGLRRVAMDMMVHGEIRSC